MNSGQPEVVVLGAKEHSVASACRRCDSGICGVEDVFKLSEVRDGLEEQGIRIEAMA